MDILALFLAVVAIFVFLMELRPPAAPRAFTLVPIGLALLAASWICQATSITDHLVNL